MDTIKRNVAYKIWIADLIKGNYFKGQEQFESGYVEIRNQKISRVILLEVMLINLPMRILYLLI